MIGKIQYTCKSCGWKAAVPEQWADLKPTYCGNRRCDYSKAMAPKTKKSFALDPSGLNTQLPEVVEDSVAVTPIKRKRTKEE